MDLSKSRQTSFKIAWRIKCFPHVLFPPYSPRFLVSPSFPSCIASQNTALESEPALSFILLRTACWQTWKQHLNPHPEFWKRSKFLQSCRTCLCSHRSSKVGWMCTTGFWKNETIWKRRAVTCANQSSFVSLPWHVYTSRCSTSWQDFCSSQLCGIFLRISVIMNFLTIIGSLLLFPFLLQVKPE